jgi:acetylornithine deacetylase/succinyl-diaminopimelate desuccinylase-like protein
LCLLSHIDTATAEPERWPEGRGPWSGTIDADGVLWGRGALDMKGLGAVETLAFLWLHRLHVPLRRDVLLLATADEEVGGGGITELIARWDELRCTHVLNEGGLGVRDALFAGQTLFAASVAEKGVLWLRMVATGPAGHGSSPAPGRAPGRLVAALEKLAAQEPEPVLLPAVQVLLGEAGRQGGGQQGLVLSHPALVRMFAMKRLLAGGSTRGVVSDTCQVTGFGGGKEPNVVPSEVYAQLDCRLLPGHAPDALLAHLREIVGDPAVRFEVLQAAPASESPYDDPFFSALVRRTLEGRPDAAMGPFLSPGTTDATRLRPLGVRAYGFEPFEVSAEEAATMHGHGERVHVATVRRALRVVLEAVLDVAAAP